MCVCVCCRPASLAITGASRMKGASLHGRRKPAAARSREAADKRSVQVPCAQLGTAHRQSSAQTHSSAQCAGPPRSAPWAARARHVPLGCLDWGPAAAPGTCWHAAASRGAARRRQSRRLRRLTPRRRAAACGGRKPGSGCVGVAWCACCGQCSLCAVTGPIVIQNHMHRCCTRGLGLGTGRRQRARARASGRRQRCAVLSCAGTGVRCSPQRQQRCARLRTSPAASASRAVIVCKWPRASQ